MLGVALLHLALACRGGTATGDFVLNAQDATMRLILIPAGEAIFGANDSPNADEKRQFTASLPAYYLGETEVTNAQYKLFVDATGHGVPLRR